MLPVRTFTFTLPLILLAAAAVTGCAHDDAADRESATGASTPDDSMGPTETTDPSSGLDSNDAAGPGTADSSPSASAFDLEPNGSRACTGAAEPVLAERDFEHLSTDLMVAVAGAEHSAQDVLVTDAAPVVIPGKFAYGRLSKDLEDEDVTVLVDDCTEWLELGTVRTDDDGRTSVRVDPVGLGLAWGRHDVRQVVRGDGTSAHASLGLYPTGTRLAVIDIDGTLTVGDSEIFVDAIDEYFLELHGGDYVPEAYPDADALTWALHEKGWVIVYVTGRPYWLGRITREWLAREGFAPGYLHTTNSELEVLPTEGGVQAFKAATLTSLRDRGFEVDLAFGNATTDIGAYAAVGVDPARTWIIGENAGLHGTVPVSAAWTEVVREISEWPTVAQPF